MLTSRQYIPDLWAQKLACPLCKEPQTEVFRSANKPDQIICKQCGLMLEVEEGGSRLKITAVPKGLSSKVIGRWFSLPELQEIGRRLAEKRAAAKNPATGSSPSDLKKPENVRPFTDTHLPDSIRKERKRVKELYALGNSARQIRASFVNTDAFSPADINSIMAEIEGLEKKKHDNQRKRLTVILVIMFVFVLCIISCVLATQAYRNGFNIDLTGSNQTHPTDSVIEKNRIQSEQLPEPLRTFIPAGASIINPPTPQVQLLSPAIGQSGRCPRNPLEAAQLFGGSADTWQAADMNRGWLYIAKEPVNITVPANMSAGYLVFDLSSMEMRSVIGPAVIQNVYMITISCE